jgi:predicted phage terminase large subunit-like protein
MQTSSALQAAAARELLRRRRGRASLTGYANAIEIPGKPAVDDPDAWLFRPVETGVAAHHLLLLQAIERTAARRHGRLMVFMPPGSAKSTYCSVVAPSYLMGRRRDMRVILASYGSDLARRHGRRARQVVKSPGFASIFGCDLSSGTSAADEWALTNGSEYLAGGILSGITGNRAHGLFIDDPVKGREQADSPTIRAKTWDAYNDDLLTRLIPGGFVVLVQTRWHEDDLAGRLLPKGYAGQSGLIECTDGKTWEVINLPACCERDDDPLGRKIGEYLWPEWFDDAHWATFRAQSRTWAALFQQRPRPDEGGIFKESWCAANRWNAIPIEARQVVHSWDTAQKPDQINDPSVGTAWRLGRGTPGYYLTDVHRDRIDYPTLKRRVISWAERDHPAAILIEDKSSGQSLIQELRSTTSLPIIAIEPDGNKIFRAQDVSAMVEAGLLRLPASAPWLTDFEGEFFGFPLSTHDDQVDSVTQFLAWARGWSGSLQFAGAGLTRTIADHLPEVEHGTDAGWGSIGRGDDFRGF